MTQTITANAVWSVDRIYHSVGEDELLELEASGQAVDNVNWYWGRKAAEWIARGLPSMYVYSAIGKKVGRASVTIRQCYYTYKTFRDVELDERVPYSVYNHARQWNDPEAVIDYYMTHVCSVDEIETVFRVSDTDDERETFAKTGLPTFLIGAWREMKGLTKQKYGEAIGYLNSFLEVVEWRRDERA